MHSSPAIFTMNTVFLAFNDSFAYLLEIIITYIWSFLSVPNYQKFKIMLQYDIKIPMTKKYKVFNEAKMPSKFFGYEWAEHLGGLSKAHKRLRKASWVLSRLP